MTGPRSHGESVAEPGLEPESSVSDTSALSLRDYAALMSFKEINK